jgi:uncharacterized damage-inducible protein DinB
MEASMNLADILTLYEYNYWANKRILAAAAKLSPEQLAAAAAFPWGGLRGTLVHTLDAEFGWRSFLQHGAWPEELKESDFATFEHLMKRWQDEESLMREYLASLEDAVMAETKRYTTETGLKRERLLWHCLFHVVNHGTQHRSEAAALLTDFAQSPGGMWISPIF